MTPLATQQEALHPFNQAVFVDRDGVLNELHIDPGGRRGEAPRSIRDVHLIAGVTMAIRELQRHGYFVVCVTNQPAAAKREISLAEVQGIHHEIMTRLACADSALDGEYVCYHHPDGTEPSLTQSCCCRKPAPGMLLQAISDLNLDVTRSWMVGDTDGDIAAGQNVGVRTILISNPQSAHKRLSSIKSDLVAANLVEAASKIIAFSDHEVRDR
jgi:D-glycero-D-manno-heptose 1,7-bisphosphate phosphatase